ncbi:MAG: EMC3/TMCO1 family protein [Candidatus Marsarchaeota archaeon]|nr:EMC3/TMCO1 family protein [Candidatus Marsarchaeota archaeon]MCL5094763.1 EMC3/TMCO1 family protein [Candidatus Marsarchaeota archaeon]
MFIFTTIPLPFHIELAIIIISILYISFTLFIQRKVSDTKKMRQIQSRIQEVSKELNELIKNKAPNEEISKKQKEVMPLITSSLKLQLKPMFIIFPLFALIYYIALPTIFKPVSADTIKIFSYNLNYQSFFFAIVFILGIISSIIILIYDKKLAAKEKKELELINKKQ